MTIERVETAPDFSRTLLTASISGSSRSGRAGYSVEEGRRYLVLGARGERGCEMGAFFMTSDSCDFGRSYN